MRKECLKKFMPTGQEKQRKLVHNLPNKFVQMGRGTITTKRGNEEISIAERRKREEAAGGYDYLQKTDRTSERERKREDDRERRRERRIKKQQVFLRDLLSVFVFYKNV